MALDCTKFNEYLGRRVPNFDKELAKDRFPHNFTYSGLYPTATWPPFTGTEHTWERVHVTNPNDNGCWDRMTLTNGVCNNLCDQDRKFTGYGVTSATTYKYKRDYQSQVFCLDNLRHVEEAVAKLAAIIEGHKKLPDEIISNFIRMQSAMTADYIYICGSGLASLAVSAGTFATCDQIDMESEDNLPTSKLTMNYLNHYAPQLMYNGYHKNEFIPDGKFTMFTDIQTMAELCQQNPVLAGMYNAADFAKGGKYWQFGAMMGAGNFLFKVDPMPLRFQHIGSGVLERVYPFENVAATVGLKPQFDAAYENAPYQLYHVYNTAARKVLVNNIPSVHPDMKFLSRDLMGKWSWKNPDVIITTDPTTGESCTLNNDKKNKGYFLAEFELGIKTEFPEIEMFILALREPACVVDIPRCASTPERVYQDLTPYNGPCETEELV